MPVKEFDFALALAILKSGGKVARQGWNGFKYGGLKMYVQAQFPDENSANNVPYLYMVGGENRVPWSPSNLDLFESDWVDLS